MRAEYGVPVSRPKLAIDFEYVEPHQRIIDGRLRNWARSQHNGTPQKTAAGFDQYQSPPSVRRDRDAPIVVDQLDASKIWSGVKSLPEHHRLALAWCYIKKSSPAKGIRLCKTSPSGLWQLIRDGRQMLINRCV